MALNGIDTSSYQTGLDYSKVPMDFAIVKATQGVDYVNPDFNRSITQAIKTGKLVGAYHYAEGKNAVSEADFFLKVVGSLVGKCILALDWESTKPDAGGYNPVFNTSGEVAWCHQFADRIKQKTGVNIFVYMSKSVCRRRNWSSVAKTCPLWVAQYANYNRTGYQTSPWTDSGGCGAWESPAIFQYSSAGMLSGWNGNLDMDIAYLTRDQWNAYAKGTGTQKKEDVPFPNKTDTDLAIEVWADIHGGGEVRQKALGSRYDAVQKDVEYLATANISTIMGVLRSYERKHGALYQ